MQKWTLKIPLCFSICQTVDTKCPKERGISSQESHTGRRKRHLPKGKFVSWKEILQGPHILSDHLPGWDRSPASIPEGPVIGRTSDPVIGKIDRGCLDVHFLGSLLNFDPHIRTWRQTYEVCWSPLPSSQCGHWINLLFMLSIFNLALNCFLRMGDQTWIGAQAVTSKFDNRTKGWASRAPLLTEKSLCSSTATSVWKFHNTVTPNRIRCLEPDLAKKGKVSCSENHKIAERH